LLAGRARRLTLLIGLPALAAFDAGATFLLANTVGSARLVEPWRALEARHVASLDLLPGGLARLPVSNDSTGYGPGPTNKNLVRRWCWAPTASTSRRRRWRWSRGRQPLPPSPGE
jgi:hypothetical protein